MTIIQTRIAPEHAMQQLIQHGYPASLARIFAARGIQQAEELDTSFNSLHSFTELKNATEMAKHLADAIEQNKKLLVIADYDADGATACTIAVRGLRMFGAKIDFIVPNRFEYGYGLTPEIVELAAQSQPDILLTVDNGIASVDGVRAANQLGLSVLVTDHHLPGDELPDALCIVNPNQPHCPFPSKNLAGVGVMFYVLMALRAELRQRGKFNQQPEPKLAELLDIVALGTIADVVKLDQNNRVLVQQGVQRIRNGLACHGINALLQVAKKNISSVQSLDLGFTVGPRLNAAGRLDDMSLGILCLLSKSEQEAFDYAQQLDSLNRERRSIETDMRDEAMTQLENISNIEDCYTLSLFDENWHQGVIGILASRLKDRYHRPTIIFAPGNEGEIKGSGRSIPNLHLRDALDLVSKRHPQLIKKFGGHAAAAGLTINESSFETFKHAFEQACREQLTEADLAYRIETDGSLPYQDIQLDTARQLERYVWGQGFPAPQFSDTFFIHNQRVVGEKHLKLLLRPKQSNTKDRPIDAILFGHNEFLPEQVDMVYHLSVNEFRGEQNLQLIIQHWQA